VFKNYGQVEVWERKIQVSYSLELKLISSTFITCSLSCLQLVVKVYTDLLINSQLNINLHQAVNIRPRWVHSGCGRMLSTSLPFIVFDVSNNSLLAMSFLIVSCD